MRKTEPDALIYQDLKQILRVKAAESSLEEVTGFPVDEERPEQIKIEKTPSDEMSEVTTLYHQIFI